jgi:hypothetical protein
MLGVLTGLYRDANPSWHGLCSLSLAQTRLGVTQVADADDLTVEVKGSDIIVRMPGTANVATYHKPAGAVHLVVRGSPVGPINFRVRAWTLANEKAQEAGLLN